MADTAVVNASPLICLCRAGLSDLLRQAAETVVVPASVAREILARGPGDVTAGVLTASPWLKQVDDPSIPPSILAWISETANRQFWRGPLPIRARAR